MLEIKNVEIFNLCQSIVASGFPMATGELIKSFDFDVKDVEDYIANIYNKGSDKQFPRGHRHVKRAIKLANTPSGSGHDSFMKGIRVSFNLKYPEYISPQLQRYNWFDIVSSESKMQRITKIDIQKSCNKYVDKIVIDNLNRWVDLYNNTNDAELKYFRFMKIVSNCPLGLEKWMHISTNYMQLKTIYNQRKNHKLKEDYTNLIKMIEELPLSKELITNDKS